MIASTIAIPSSCWSFGSGDLREVLDEGPWLLGVIVAGAIGTTVGYPILFVCFAIKYLFINNKPILQNSKNEALKLRDDFMTNFLLVFCFIGPFLIGIPMIILMAVIFPIPSMSMTKAYLIYTLFSLILTSTYTLRKHGARKT
jgi:hypothetical protein